MIATRSQVMADDDILDSPISQTFSARFDHLAGEEDGQLPWRHDKASRRESRLGLRGIFGRSKLPKENGTLPHTIHEPRSPASRTSLAGLSHWPRAHKSEGTLLSGPSWQHLPATPETPQEDQGVHHDAASARRRKIRPKTPKQPRDVPAHWSMPPLFKAFPQAVRHVTLPATTLPADTILRFNEKKANASSPQDSAGPLQDAEQEPQEAEKDKKKPRRNGLASAENLEWTTKIYILVTSGYLLQYAGDGHFDRLPEKVLRLGPSSAAFATDAIPGRHWVVHVSSTAQADGTPTSESRSLFSKLPFRVDKRSTSNLLMVFEGADVMEAWISTLRGVIEKLGGKKNLSETGKPKTEEATQRLREQPSQRTLIVRDLSRFNSNRLSRAPPDADRIIRAGETSPRVTSSDTARDQSIDDVSTTNSTVSQDERQLDSLRESSQRLSYISSGQRTIVTSTGSSPERSPTQDGFPSHADELAAHTTEPTTPDDETRKYRSSFLDIGGPRSRSVEPSRAAKRMSVNSIMSDRSYEYHQSFMPEPPQAPPPSGPLPPIPPQAGEEAAAVGSKPRTSVFNRRRSLPQLAGGPPPAPPPTRALPPIPQKVQVRT
ncbi:peptidase family M20/M25/M40 protein [Purpureocillium lavendulum]|uniref:Peptidase family M20/M25/M40 protein n=1 Tax=Purpureocillium lavendulum TaxID=1247861 RepID=A0AB34FYY3_9HYPO|nr:peptidase family M20/M25/M40 protein [Purpureocillium lavendulum]